MSNFDWIDIRDNNVGIPYDEKNYLYQTKAMSCDLYRFKLNDQNQLIHDLTSSRYSYYLKHGIYIPTEPILFNGEMEIRRDLNEERLKKKEVSYFLYFENSIVIRVDAYTSGGTVYNSTVWGNSIFNKTGLR